MAGDTQFEKPTRIYVSEPLTGPLPPGWEDVQVCVIGKSIPRSDFRQVLRQAFRVMTRRAVRVILRR